MYNVQIRPLDHSDLTDQVTNALMNSCNNELMNFSYSYDAMGNRKQASELSASSGISALSVYSANNLNQYTFISNHVGSLQPTAYSLQPSYDLNGNMTWDGTNAYFWDLQNQLILVSNAEVQVSSAYDAMGRRIRKEVTVWDEQLTAYRSQFTSHFYYDGWNLVRETVQLNSLTPPNSLTNYYTWGNDLSGSLQGAGGVGGLLAVSCVSSNTSYLLPLTYYPLYDHNGNVERYVSRNGATVAAFQYDAFGNTVTISGTLADSFAFRFSTKYGDAETGLYYYGYRFYCSWLGRWVNRDPIGEKGGVNIYHFVFNNVIRWIDYNGLWGDGNEGRNGDIGGRGHSDFPGHDIFDYTREDRGDTSPFRPSSTWRHFRPLGDRAGVKGSCFDIRLIRRCGAGRRLLRWSHGETAQASLRGRVVPHHDAGHGAAGHLCG